MVRSILIALTLGALALLPQDAAADDRRHGFKNGHHQGQVARFHAPPKVFHFGTPYKRWQHKPAPRYFAPPGYRAWMNNPRNWRYAPPPRRAWAYRPWWHKPRHHGHRWRW